MNRRFFSLLTALGCASNAQCEPAPVAPHTVAVSRVGMSPGEECVLRVRGTGLEGATSARIAGAKVEIVERASGELKLRALLPKGTPEGIVKVEIVTPAGIATSELRVTDAAKVIAEKEPNDSPGRAQVVEVGKTIRGAIGAKDDVDVFTFTMEKGQKITVELFARRGGSLLSGPVKLYDSRRRAVVEFVQEGGKDPSFVYFAQTAGRYFLAVLDGRGEGSEWHGYEARIKTEK